MNALEEKKNLSAAVNDKFIPFFYGRFFFLCPAPATGRVAVFRLGLQLQCK